MMSKQIAKKKLLHWNQKGELVLKNKVKEAILRENAHEERSLDSMLHSLDRHKIQEERYLENKQHLFATTIMKTHEKHHLGTGSYREQQSRSPSLESLPRTQELDTGAQRQTNKPRANHKSEAKRKWTKAISAVRFAVREKSTSKSNNKRKEGKDSFTLPPLHHEQQNGGTFSRRLEHENTKHGKSRNDNKHARKSESSYNLPDIHKKEEKKDFLQDPRFKKLEEALSQRPATQDHNGSAGMEGTVYGSYRLRSFSNRY